MSDSEKQPEKEAEAEKVILGPPWITKNDKMFINLFKGSDEDLNKKEQGCSGYWLRWKMNHSPSQY